MPYHSFPLLPAALLALSLPCLADRPRLDLEKETARITFEDQRLTISLTDAVLRLQTPHGDYVLTPSLKQNDTVWTRPSRATASPRIVRQDDRIHFECVYPVPDDRQFTVEVDAYPDTPAFFITSRLKSLSGTRGEYYFWQTNASAREYAFPGAGGVEKGLFAMKEWSLLDWKEWLFLAAPAGNAAGQTRGLVFLPTNCVGRSPGEAGCVYLHALPRSNVLGPGDSLDASFGIAGAKDAAGAAALSAAARARHTPALEPWRHQPAATQPAVPPAPQWLREAGTYNLYYQSAAQWTNETIQERLRQFPFIIGSTPDKAALDNCHNANIRLLHYVVYICLLDTDLQVRGGGTVYGEWKESVDNESRDLKNHPDWVCIQADGSIRHDAWGHGLAVLNPASTEAAVRIPVTHSDRLTEVGYAREVAPLDGHLNLKLPPISGRVLVNPTARQRIRLSLRQWRR
jgi:hypothetical protein